MASRKEYTVGNGCTLYVFISSNPKDGSYPVVHEYGLQDDVDPHKLEIAINQARQWLSEEGYEMPAVGSFGNIEYIKSALRKKGDRKRAITNHNVYCGYSNLQQAVYDVTDYGSYRDRVIERLGERAIRAMIGLNE